MSRTQLQFCKNLREEERAMIRVRATSVFKTGGFSTKLLILGIAISVVNGDSMQDIISNTILSPIGGADEVY